MRTLIPFILLAFPIAEIYLLFKLADQYGWWLLVYLVVIGYLGLQLIKGEKILMGPKMMQSLTQGGNPIRAMLGTARNMIAGVLLLIPGVITDAIAVVLLLIPVKGDTKTHQTDFGHQRQGTDESQPQYEHTAEGHVIEGEYEHVNDPKKDNQNKLGR